MYLKLIACFALGGIIVGGVDHTNMSPSRTLNTHDLISDYKPLTLAQIQARSINVIHERTGFSGDAPRLTTNCYCTESSKGNLTPPTVNCDSAWQKANKVSIGLAQQLVAEYEIWRQMVPKFYSLEGNTISFEPIELSQEMMEAAFDRSMQYNIAHHRPIDHVWHIPFSTDSSLARSYYIPKNDVMALFCKYPQAQGVRAHIAWFTESLWNADEMGSHIYLAPAISNTVDVPLNEVPCLFDLTMPCPSTCGSDILKFQCK
jgi:hypothetical protein